LYSNGPKSSVTEEQQRHGEDTQVLEELENGEAQPVLRIQVDGGSKRTKETERIDRAKAARQVAKVDADRQELSNEKEPNFVSSKKKKTANKI
jgi:hypothetical protein